MIFSKYQLHQTNITFYDKLNSNFIKFGVFSKNLSVDEQMVSYYDHCFLKQFIYGKTIRFAFKEWLLFCGETQCAVFKPNFMKAKKYGLDLNVEATVVGSSVVLSKVCVAENPENHLFYFNNFFTIFELMENLIENNVCANGTVRYKRMNSCPTKTDKEMKKDRGDNNYRFNKNNNSLLLLGKITIESVI